MTYPTPDGTVETTTEIKKSQFHGFAGKATTREEAMALLAACKTQYPDARHHCWAYQFGPPNQPTSAAMSDDGEPSGTAGKPILNVIQHSGASDIIIVVSRYFGGIKLGAGGLIRAYSGAAQHTLEQLPVVTHVAMQTLIVTTDFKHEQLFRHLTASLDGQLLESDYSQTVRLHIALPKAHIAALKERAASINATVALV